MRNNPWFEFNGYVEKDPHAVKAYNALHNTNHKPIDIRDYQGKANEYHIIIIAGFPCQDVSQAGKNNVEKGQRTILYMEMLRVIKEIKPKCIILENVKGLLQKKHKIHYDHIMKTLASYYKVKKMILTPLQFGIPQSRPRLFLAGFYKAFEKVDPITLIFLDLQLWGLEQRPNDEHPPLKEFLDKDIPYTDNSPIWKEGKNYYIAPRKKDKKLISSGFRQMWKPENFSGTITTRSGHGGVGELFPKNSVGGYQISKENKHSPTITGSIRLQTGKEHNNVLYYRHLTITECARLMGWERGVAYFNTLPKTRAQKLLGNAIVVPVLKAIMETIWINLKKV